MTLKQYRTYLQSNPVECFGMNFSLFSHDIVRIRTDKDSYETKYDKFLDVKNNLHLSDKIWELEITDIIVRKDEPFSHTVVLILDTTNNDKESKIDNEVIQARMKMK